MNTSLFSRHAADQRRITDAKRDGTPIIYSAKFRLLEIEGVLLGSPSHLLTRADAEAYATLHGFKLAPQ